MLSKKEDYFLELKSNISKEKKIVKEIITFFDDLQKEKDPEEEKIIIKQLNSLRGLLKKTDKNIRDILGKIPTKKSLSYYTPPIAQKITSDFVGEKFVKKKNIKRKKGPKLSKLEKETLKRLKEKEKKAVKKKERKANKYIRVSNRLFSNFSMNLIKKKMFKALEIDLVKANLNFLIRSYVSVIFFTTLLAFIVSIFIFVFFMFFNIGVALPIITVSDEGIGMRFLKTFWILLAIPLITFLAMYFYPFLERDSVERKINQELPFATINMAAISGSLIDPSKIFNIIVLTKEYPYLEKEFIKLMNSVNVLGYDLVSALRNSAFNTSSKKLGDLFNGIATTINSGGDLPKFFDERAKTLLFEYNLEKEKGTKAAETFMDIYISVVIAAPMILMLLLMMMRISGLGIPISTAMITLIMVLGVTMINIGFMTFLHLRQSYT